MNTTITTTSKSLPSTTSNEKVSMKTHYVFYIAYGTLAVSYATLIVLGFI